MGMFFTKHTDNVQETPKVTPTKVGDEDTGLEKIRKTLNQELENFLLNNILLSVQFFENFEREVKNLRDNPVSESDAERNRTLAEHQRHCVSPDRLYEAVGRHVMFRPADGDRSETYELLHSPRLLVVQDNVEVVASRDEAVYSTVLETPSYRFTMETATDHHPGYMKIRAEECMLPHKRRATYETIKDEDEGVYTHIPSDSPNEPDSARNTVQEQDVETDNNSSPLATGDLTDQHMMTEIPKETEYAGKAPPFHDVQPTVKNSTQSQRRYSTKRVFGPQHPDCDPNNASTFTPTERRLSGVTRMHRQVDVDRAKKNVSALKSAHSLPNLAVMHSPKNSGSSGYKSEGGSPNNNANGSEYGYTTITELTTPRPLEERRLGHVPRNTSEIPEQCFHDKVMPLYDDDDDRGNFKRRNNLFESRYYLNSINFMQSFADIFADKIGSSLGFTGALNSATLQGTKIYCDITKQHHDSKPIKIRNEISPTIFSAIWPEEALKWKTRKRNINGQVPGTQYTWPTSHMVDQVLSYGCHLLPLGYIPTRSKNDEEYLEWQLAFPEAERYLETQLTHAQVRCLLFSMALYKTFLEPLNAQLGLLPTHIRTMLFWQCEQDYANWQENRPGEILCKFLEKLYEAIMNKHLKDYFIERRNLFESTPRKHLFKVQEKLKRIKENLVMHMLLAVRNLRYVKSSFYPVFDYKKLYAIITCDNLVPILNPRLQQPTINTITPKNKQSKQQQSEEEESDEEETNSNIDLWKPVTAQDVRKKWKQDVRTQIEIERAAQRLVRAPKQKTRKPATDSIDVKLQPKKSADKLRKMALLEFFIPHFIAIAKKSNSFRATRQARFYLKHAERLVQLLRECDDGISQAWSYSYEINTLKEAMGEESSYGTAPTPRPFVPTQLKLPLSSGVPKDRQEQTSVPITPQTPPQDNNIFITDHPFRKKMTLPQVHVHPILKNRAILGVPLPSAETSDEQSHPKTNTVTATEVHKPSTSRTIPTPPSTSSRPKIVIDVTDALNPSHTLVLNEDITNESTDT